MSQIRPNQVIQNKPSKANPVSAFPRDLSGVELILDEKVEQNAITLTTQDGILDVTENTYISPDTSTQIENSPPRTPAIIGVRSQTVGFQPDGTAKVDLVLIVEDIDGITEYDIRVAKNAGNL